MKELAQNWVTDEFVKAIWLERLPIHTQAILSVSTANLSELSILADKINEIKAESAVCKISESLGACGQENTVQISALQNQIGSLTLQVSELTKVVSTQALSRDRTNYR
ncbi:hypothetical protein AVEN_191838-1 [Araneus ventricosus]|uniref:Uncharacterized protein n=1 Tax=Araneus ventricosus TaxID=182803 RepID=A0A4Y2EZM6_ARAVE|nr:hypothetical protein AVEN_191838-1 [Araneus ventricosus]